MKKNFRQRKRDSDDDEEEVKIYRSAAGKEDHRKFAISSETRAPQHAGSKQAGPTAQPAGGAPKAAANPFRVSHAARRLGFEDEEDEGEEDAALQHLHAKPKVRKNMNAVAFIKRAEANELRKKKKEQSYSKEVLEELRGNSNIIIQSDVPPPAREPSRLPQGASVAEEEMNARMRELQQRKEELQRMKDELAAQRNEDEPTTATGVGATTPLPLMTPVQQREEHAARSISDYGYNVDLINESDAVTQPTAQSAEVNDRDSKGVGSNNKNNDKNNDTDKDDGVEDEDDEALEAFERDQIQKGTGTAYTPPTRRKELKLADASLDSIFSQLEGIQRGLDNSTGEYAERIAIKENERAIAAQSADAERAKIAESVRRLEFYTDMNWFADNLSAFLDEMAPKVEALERDELENDAEYFSARERKEGDRAVLLWQAHQQLVANGGDEGAVARLLQPPDVQEEYNKFVRRRETIVSQAEALFNDVEGEFKDVHDVVERFAEWKREYPRAYRDAYVGMSLSQVLVPLLRRTFVADFVLPVGGYRDIEETRGFVEIFGLYEEEGDDEGRGREKDDGLDKLVESVVEEVVAKRVLAFVERCLDLEDTALVAALAKYLANLVFFVEHKGATFQSILRSIVVCIDERVCFFGEHLPRVGNLSAEGLRLLSAARAGAAARAEAAFAHKAAKVFASLVLLSNAGVFAPGVLFQRMSTVLCSHLCTYLTSLRLLFELRPTEELGTAVVAVLEAVRDAWARAKDGRALAAGIEGMELFAKCVRSCQTVSKERLAPVLEDLPV